MLNKLLKVLVLFVFIHHQSFAEDVDLNSQQENLSQDAFYSALLKKHQNQGHLNSTELKNYQFEYTKDKSWQENFNNQVRGVASTLKVPREKIYLSNPPIEISVK